MDALRRLKSKIEQIEKLIAECKRDIEDLGQQPKVAKTRERKIEAVPSEQDLQLEYGRLYEEFIADHPRVVEDFIKNRSKVYLKAFCKANKLPIDTSKVSKDGIAREAMQWMAQRKLITQKST